MNCEMCGREGELFKTNIEGTELNVCENCSKHGNVLKRLRPEIKMRQSQKKIKLRSEPEIIEAIVENYASKIRKAREKKGMTQKEFAMQIQQKESLLQKMETNNFEPSIPLARKLEKMLRIKLVEEKKIENPAQINKSSGAGLTIGDLIKIKK